GGPQDALRPLDHSGFTRSDVSDNSLAALLYNLTEGRIGPVDAVAQQLLEMREYTAFEPHVQPYFQTCIGERPRLATPYNYVSDTPFEDLSRAASYVIVSQGEDDNFVYRLRPRDTLIFRFGPESDRGPI